MKNIKILVTGGAGFIGSEFVHQAVNEGYSIIIVDKLTYAGDMERLKDVNGRFEFYKTDIYKGRKIREIFEHHNPDIVVHFAAETHVDRSILGSAQFVKTNINGTQNLLDAAKDTTIKLFINISTDEVYGEIEKGRFSETAPLNPSSPYSASKAAADLLIKSYIRTFDFPAIIVRPSNNYGPWQYPEKFIPVVIYKALRNEKIPVYGKGINVREWLYVSDCASAILAIMKKGRAGGVYNVGSGFEKRNIDIAKAILDVFNKPHSLIEFVKDRPGHDYRYSLDCSKIKKELNWSPAVKFEDGIAETINSYTENFGWLENKAVYLKNYWKSVYKK